ncbi:MAG: PaaI family thioesterase [Clostridia bacterium]|nr:PaaI family thioesterase [Clostridia bacterium]
MNNSERKINPEHIRQVIDMTNSCPYYQLLGMKIVELGSGYARVEMDAEHKHMNPFGSVHGGCYASLIDSATYWAAYWDQDEDAGFTTLDLSVSDLSMARAGKLVVEATAIKEGRSVCLCEAKITDASGRIIAFGTSKLMMLKGRQSIADAIRSLGYADLPAKFIEE